MKSLKRLCPVLSVILLLLAGCNSSTPPTTSPAKGGSGTSGGTFHIGSALPLSGAIAYYGDSSKKGITIALEEVNTEGGVRGKKLEVIYEDTLGNAKGAVSALRKLVDVNKVPAVIGAGSSTETLAIAKIAEENKVVLISPVSSAAEIRDAGEFVFRSVPSDGIQAKMLAEWVLEKGKSNIGVLFVNSSWGTSLKNNFVREYTSRGGQALTVESSEIDDKDFRTQLLNIKQSNPDAVVAITYAKEGGRVMKQAREQGMHLPFFGADPWTIKDFVDIAGPAAESVMFTTPGKHNGPEYQAFRKKFVDKFGKEPDVYAGHGYDCLKLVAMAINEGGATGTEIQKTLAKVSGFNGVTGTTTFDDHGDVVSNWTAPL